MLALAAVIMKSDTLALVLANMNSETAKTLTVKLADRLTLPQTTPPAPAVPVAEASPPARCARFDSTGPSCGGRRLWLHSPATPGPKGKTKINRISGAENYA